MKRLLLSLMALSIIGAFAFANGNQESSTKAGKAQKVIGYFRDGPDVYYKDGYEVFKALANKEGWKVVSIVGNDTAPAQINAVQNFITQKVDAMVVIQDTPRATQQTLKLANQAGIPEFNLTQTPQLTPKLSGFSGYDWVTDGEIAAKNAMAHGVKKLIIIEGKLGQGAAGGQTKGFLLGYKNAGKDIGNLLNSVGVRGAGGSGLKVVYWASGNWFADPAKKAMENAITALGPNGWDGAYVENDDMMKGAIEAIQQAGLNPANYWLGSSNGREDSWQWVSKGWETFDVSESPTLEADLCFQQIKANFAGKPYKKFVYSHLLPFTKANVHTANLIPWEPATYLKERAEGKFIYELTNARFKPIPVTQ